MGAYEYENAYEYEEEQEQEDRQEDADEEQEEEEGSSAYWMFEVVFLCLLGVAIFCMLVTVQRKEWLETLRKLNEQRANRRKFGFNRINVVFDTTEESDVLSENDQIHKLMHDDCQQLSSGDEHFGPNPMQEAQHVDPFLS